MDKEEMRRRSQLVDRGPVEAPRDDIMQYFSYAHLPEHLQAYSKPFSELAEDMVQKLPRCPERTVMLRKLVEAKDCAVRAFIWKPQS